MFNHLIRMCSILLMDKKGCFVYTSTKKVRSSVSVALGIDSRRVIHSAKRLDNEIPQNPEQLYNYVIDLNAMLIVKRVSFLALFAV